MSLTLSEAFRLCFADFNASKSRLFSMAGYDRFLNESATK